MNLKQKASEIKALVLDIDGVLTNGLIGYSGISGEEIKFFHVRDGHGLKLARRVGLKIGALSGRTCGANKKRAAELEFDFLYEGKKDKGAAFEVLLKELNLKDHECLYIGDDVVDIPILRRAGIAVTVADAPGYMDEYCDFRTTRKGGEGAVREVIEMLLKEKGQWEELMRKYI
jgi:3-deoxy-D-manno-octulosonate 8-phosphate phosphatase (KDO 8-P phosphatase)